MTDSKGAPVSENAHATKGVTKKLIWMSFVVLLSRQLGAGATPIRALRIRTQSK
jgi:hypothetical protein